MIERERQMFEQANRYQNNSTSEANEPMPEDRNTTSSRPTLRWPDPPGAIPNYSIRPRPMYPQGMGNNSTKPIVPNSMQGNVMQGNAVPRNTTQGNPMQGNPMQGQPMQSKPMQGNSRQGYSMQGYSMQSKPMSQKTIQNQPIQSNTIQSNTMQSNTMQNNTMPGSTTSKYNLNINPSVVKSNSTDKMENIISSERLQEAIIWSEILGKPLSKKRNRRYKG